MASWSQMGTPLWCYSIPYQFHPFTHMRDKVNFSFHMVQPVEEVVDIIDTFYWNVAIDS